jgi:endonuclease/exonuclease/phosphatase (EEP) superfamily protein YafD
MRGGRLQQKLLATAITSLFLWGVGVWGVMKPARSVLVTAADQRHLRVMSWNAHFLNKKSATFFATVAAEQPDLIAIQELGTPLAEAISSQLREHFPYQELYPARDPAGMAILSRYPFVTTTPPDFSPLSGCNCHPVTLDLAGQTITLINTHPWPPKTVLTGGGTFDFDTTNQDRIFDQLLLRIEQAASPLLVVGDFNTMPIQANYRRMTQVLQDAYATSGVGPTNTFPVARNNQSWLRQPLLRIDYIFYDTAWQAQKTWVGAIDGSDHRYVMAELTLNRP